MYLVSREVLFDVMSHKRDISFKPYEGQLAGKDVLHEVDSVDMSAFNSLVSTAKVIYDEAKKASTGAKQTMTVFNDTMYYFMKANRDVIRYVDAGSSRTVYALANGTVAKIASTPAGIAQNKQEAKLCMNDNDKY